MNIYLKQFLSSVVARTKEVFTSFRSHYKWHVAKGSSTAITKGENLSKNIMLIAFIFLCTVIFFNFPINSADAYAIGWQFVITVFFAAVGIWISEIDGSAMQKALSFAGITTIAFLSWNLAGPLDQAKELIKCSVDVLIFKDGSGSVLEPQVSANFGNTDRYLNGELRAIMKLVI